MNPMLNLIVLILFYVTFPLFLIWLTMKYPFFKKIGAIVLAYGLGIIIANVGILPKGSDAFRDATMTKNVSFLPEKELNELIEAGILVQSDTKANNVASIQDWVQTAIVPLALPLILFSLSIRRWFRFAGKGFLSLLLALVSVVVIVASGFFIFGDKIPEADKVAGMLIGCYTGGTVNMASLAVALKVEPNAFVMTNTYDMIVGALTILFFITLGPRFFRWFLPPFKKAWRRSGQPTLSLLMLEKQMSEDFDDFSGMFRKGTFLPLLGSLGLAVFVFAAGFIVSLLLPKGTSDGICYSHYYYFGGSPLILSTGKKYKKDFSARDVPDNCILTCNCLTMRS